MVVEVCLVKLAEEEEGRKAARFFLLQQHSKFCAAQDGPTATAPSQLRCVACKPNDAD